MNKINIENYNYYNINNTCQKQYGMSLRTATRQRRSRTDDKE